MLDLLNKVHTTNTHQAQPVDLNTANVKVLKQAKNGKNIGKNTDVVDLMNRTGFKDASGKQTPGRNHRRLVSLG